MNNIGLICVTHDPNGNNLAYIKKYAYKFKKLYANMYITVSEESNRQNSSKLMHFIFIKNEVKNLCYLQEFAS